VYIVRIKSACIIIGGTVAVCQRGIRDTVKPPAPEGE